jgi:hypothetical protein
VTQVNPHRRLIDDCVYSIIILLIANYLAYPAQKKHPSPSSNYKPVSKIALLIQRVIKDKSLILGSLRRA